MDAAQWIVYSIISAAVVSMAGGLFAFPKAVDYLVMVLFSFGMPGFLLRPLMQYTWNVWEGILWTACTGLFIMTLWVLTKRAAAVFGILLMSSVTLVVIAFIGFILLLLVLWGAVLWRKGKVFDVEFLS